MRTDRELDMTIDEATAVPDGRRPIHLDRVPRRRRRARWIAGALILVVVPGAGIVWALSTKGAANGAAAPTAAPSSTATVERRDLVERDEVDGTLAYSGSRTLSAQSAGTLTWLADEGVVVRRGDVLYRVDGLPVVLLYGKTPSYRSLAQGMDGGDVRQLEANLAALGFDPGQVDGAFDSDTDGAVRDWQEELGLERTGVVDLGRVVFQPGGRRVGSHQAAVGDLLAPGVPVTMTTSQTRVVTVDLEARRQDLAHEGDGVTVTLPDGRVVDGHVSSIGRVAQADPQDPSAEPTLAVTITLDRGAKVGALDQAPVDVGLAIDQAQGVLAVPVSALLALAEGGYAIEVVADDGSTHLVEVDLGVFADGYVEVSGQGFDEGTTVVVPE